MKPDRPSRLAESLASIAASSPSERLGDGSRYVVVADLRMGDGGRKDELAPARKAVFDVLGKWYLPRGYTLVLDGDTEDLRGFWLKNILSAWPELYAVFDAFNEAKRLRKILGDRDLALMRIRSFPYEMSHGLRLDGRDRSILLLHGHQASPPYVDGDYLSDFLVLWHGSEVRRKGEGWTEDRRARFKTEKRLYRASSRLGIVAVEGHTRRPLFESTTSRDSIRAEVERLLREGDPRAEGSRLDDLVDLLQRHRRRARVAAPSGNAYDEGRAISPCLFCPGRLLGGRPGGPRDLRMMEIEGDSLNLVRWAVADPAGPIELGGRPYRRLEIRSSSVEGILERTGLLARGAPDAPRGEPL